MSALETPHPIRPTRMKGRPLALRVVAIVTALLVGCSSAAQRASDRQELICLGMTRKDVQNRIGSPSAVRHLEPAAPGRAPVEEWTYVYGGSSAADIVGFVLVTVVVVALVAVVVVAAAGGKGGGNIGGLGGLGGGGGGGDDGNWKFALVFGPDGRVRTITPIERAGK